jgi:hypothetical protein
MDTHGRGQGVGTEARGWGVSDKVFLPPNHLGIGETYWWYTSNKSGKRIHVVEVKLIELPTPQAPQKAKVVFMPGTEQSRVQFVDIDKIGVLGGGE